MHRIIAIETATDVCSVAIFLADELVSIHSIDRPKSHAEQLVSMIRRSLEEAGFEARDLDAIAVSSGPGSYTGLRIGASTAKGLAFAVRARIIAVPSLEALAYGAMSNNSGSAVVAVSPSRRNELYTAVFRSGVDGLPRRILPEVAMQADDLGVRLAAENIQSGIIVGTGGQQAFSALPDPSAFEVVDIAPSAEFVGRCALPRARRGDFVDTSSFEPYYLKDFQARKKTGSAFDRLPF